MNRRTFLTRTSTGVLVASLVPTFGQLYAATTTPAPTTGATYPFVVTPLPYDAAALEPHIDAATMKLHHDKHHASYVTNLNAALKDHPSLHGLTVEQLLRQLDTLPAAIQTAVRNHGGGHINHEFFWQIMRPAGTAGAGATPTGKLAAALIAEFGSFEKFQTEFAAASLKVFGSGWSFLIMDHDTKKLKITTAPNQDGELYQTDRTCLLACDVWEHAYYLNYQNRRADYVKAWWNVVAWDIANRRYTV
jgi:Fe-Mn family superoxide dismutase